MRGAAVDIESADLKRLRADLKNLAPEARDELNHEIHDVAQDVASGAQRRAEALGGVAAKTAPSVKATTERRNALTAGVGLGGATAPWAAGAEFGGGARPTTQQFQPYRGSGEGAGYFLYPTIRDEAEHIEDRYLGALDRAFRREDLE